MNVRFSPFLVLALNLLFGGDLVYRVPIQRTIDLGLPPFIERSIEEAERDGAEAIIFDIDTFGGRVDGATQIKDAILDSKVLTVAFINRRQSQPAPHFAVVRDDYYDRRRDNRGRDGCGHVRQEG